MIVDSILPALLLLGGMGLTLGAVLAIAAQKFKVEIDPKIEAIEEVLSGTNCGACGYPGCSGYAQAIVEEGAPVWACTVGGAEAAHQIGAIMGVEVSAEALRQVARIVCQGEPERARENYLYQGLRDCRAAALLFGGALACDFGCIRLGTCVEVCPFDAIEDGENRIPVIDLDKCTQCGKCVAACPRNVISLVDADSEVVIACNSHEKGRSVKQVCSIGCIACGICERVCPFEAVHVVDNLAVIDYNKCTRCGICVLKCPTNCIAMDRSPVKAHIDHTCIGCGLCIKVCPMDAIEGEAKALHSVLEEKCIGCGWCAQKCPPKVQAVEMQKFHEPVPSAV